MLNTVLNRLIRLKKKTGHAQFVVAPGADGYYEVRLEYGDQCASTTVSNWALLQTWMHQVLDEVDLVLAGEIVQDLVIRPLREIAA